MVDFFQMEHEALKLTKGDDVNLKLSGNNTGKVSGLLLCLRVPPRVSHTLCSKLSSRCVETSGGWVGGISLLEII